MTDEGRNNRMCPHPECKQEVRSDTLYRHYKKHYKEIVLQMPSSYISKVLEIQKPIVVNKEVSIAVCLECGKGADKNNKKNPYPATFFTKHDCKAIWSSDYQELFEDVEIPLDTVALIKENEKLKSENKMLRLRLEAKERLQAEYQPYIDRKKRIERHRKDNHIEKINCVVCDKEILDVNMSRHMRDHIGNKDDSIALLAEPGKTAVTMVENTPVIRHHSGKFYFCMNPDCDFTCTRLCPSSQHHNITCRKWVKDLFIVESYIFHTSKDLMSKTPAMSENVIETVEQPTLAIEEETKEDIYTDNHKLAITILRNITEGHTCDDINKLRNQVDPPCDWYDWVDTHYPCIDMLRSNDYELCDKETESIIDTYEKIPEDIRDSYPYIQINE